MLVSYQKTKWGYNLALWLCTDIYKYTRVCINIVAVIMVKMSEFIQVVLTYFTTGMFFKKRDNKFFTEGKKQPVN